MLDAARAIAPKIATPAPPESTCLSSLFVLVVSVPLSATAGVVSATGAGAITGAGSGVKVASGAGVGSGSLTSFAVSISSTNSISEPSVLIL